VRALAGIVSLERRCAIELDESRGVSHGGIDAHFLVRELEAKGLEEHLDKCQAVLVVG
jgi:hypothetical protein